MKTPDDTTEHRRHGAAFWLRTMELRKHRLMREYRDTLGDKAREGISEEDLRITEETLEKMARNLGWDESDSHAFHGRGGFRGRPHGFRRHAMMRGFGRIPHPRRPAAEEPEA